MLLLLFDPSKLWSLWEQFWFEKLISFTLNWKMKSNQSTEGDDRQTIIQKDRKIRSSQINDPAMLVLVQKRKQKIVKDDEDLRRQNTSNDEKVVGMVELSLQPPDFDRNPPAAPLPLEYKQTLAKRTEIGTVQGWITNLLIDPTCRGLKYSKILMAATEGIAKTWGCKFIFLHADADIRSGRIPQRLYESLGYEVVTGNGKDDYTWAGPSSTTLNQFSAIRMIDGTALLCYSKKLEEEEETATGLSAVAP